MTKYNLSVPLNPEEIYDGDVVNPQPFYPYQFSINIKTLFCTVENTNPEQYITKFYGLVYREDNEEVVYTTIEFSYEQCFQSCMKFIKSELDKCGLFTQRKTEKTE